eukprot:97350_1
MITNHKKKHLGTSLCVCCCCMVAFGIAGIIYYERSFLNIHHECEIYSISTRLCRYACGTICHRRLVTNEVTTNHSDEYYYHSHSSSEHEHCHTRYCWGYEYVYEWKTMDWRYDPYRVQNDMSEDALHGYIVSPFNNQTQQTAQKMNTLLDYINDESNTMLTTTDIQSIDLNHYMSHTNDVTQNMSDLLRVIQDKKRPFTTTSIGTSDENSTRESIGSCDWKTPAYISSGVCSAWPIRWNSLGDTEACWTNDKCSFFSTLSPYTNWDLAEGFGIASMACLAVFVLILLYWFTCWCYGKVCGWSDYDVIGDMAYSDEEEYESKPVVVHNPVVMDEQVVINDGIAPPMYVNDQIVIDNAGSTVIINEAMVIDNGNRDFYLDEEMLVPSAPFAEEELIQEEGGVGVVERIRYDGDYTVN